MDQRIASLWRARAEINLAALNSNIAQIRTIANTSSVLAVVKADAYGHGLSTIVRYLGDKVDGFAVATLNEGMECRRILADKPIVVLSEFWDAKQLEIFEKYNLDIVVHSENQLEWLKQYRGAPLSVWIKFDTGMNRLGINSAKVQNYLDILSSLSSTGKIRIISHLANADIIGDEYTLLQHQRFNHVLDSCNQKYSDIESSLANSAGIMRWQQTQHHWIRPGIMLYGISPYRQPSDEHIHLSPVMTLKARILSVKSAEQGQPVGYGGDYITSRQSRIALVGLGYGDGYPRQVDQRACVIVHDHRVPIIGKISMDMITVDVTDCSNVVAGDEVTLWGRELNISEVADWAGTIPYELLCKVTPRIPRVAVGDVN